MTEYTLGSGCDTHKEHCRTSKFEVKLKLFLAHDNNLNVINISIIPVFQSKNCRRLKK